MFLLIEINEDCDIFEITNENFFNILGKIADYNGVHFIQNDEVVFSSSLRRTVDN